MTALLEARDLSVIFPIGRTLFRAGQSLRALNNVQFSLERGEVLALVGESGCGKSTLAKVLLGIQAPTAGEVFFDGRPLADQSRRDLARRVQPIFQDPYSSLNPRHTIADLIALPLFVRREVSTAQARAEAREMMGLVGLPRRLEHAYPGQLSGGQRQRVAIARALVTRPELVICDEPTSALDVSVQAQILNLLQEMKETFDLTYLFISHDLSTVRHFSDRVAVMYLGQIVEIGATADVIDRPLHPYAQKLKNAVLPADPSRGLPPLRFDGGFPDPTNPPPGCPFHPRCPDAFEICPRLRPDRIAQGASQVACHLYDPRHRAAAPDHSAKET